MNFDLQREPAQSDLKPNLRRKMKKIYEDQTASSQTSAR